MICFYHDDLDGRCAAACINLWSKRHNTGELEDRFIPMDYSRIFPMDLIGINEQVWIVDYSIGLLVMDKLRSKTEDITWIDHHITAIEKYESYHNPIRGLRSIDKSGALLTFQYLHDWTNYGDGDIVKPVNNRNIPRAIELVNDWDIWEFKYGDTTKYFHIGATLYDTTPTSKFWLTCFGMSDHTFPPLLYEIIDKGKVCIEYRDSWAKQYVKKLAYPIIFEGYSCIAMNLGLCNSEYFKNADTFDIQIPFYFDGNQWTVSLYSSTVDVGAIAKKYGGGGHKGAAGFQCDILPWIK